MYKTRFFTITLLLLSLSVLFLQANELDIVNNVNSAMVETSQHNTTISSIEFNDMDMGTKEVFKTSPIQLPELNECQTNSLLLNIYEEYNMSATDIEGLVYIVTKEGKTLLNTRKSVSSIEVTEVNISEYAGQNVYFEYKKTGKSGSDDTWKVKKQIILLESGNLKGQVKSITSRFNPYRESAIYTPEKGTQFVYIETQVGGPCSKADSSLSELNFSIREQDPENGNWYSKDIYMMAAPNEISTISTLDIAFCIDVSSSMGDLEVLEESIKDFLHELDKKEIRYRIALVLFADEVMVLKDGEFYLPPYQTEQAINSISTFSGTLLESVEIDTASNQFGAIALAANLNYLKESKKAIIMCTNTPSVDDSGLTLPPYQYASLTKAKLGLYEVALYPMFEIDDALQYAQYTSLITGNTTNAINVNQNGIPNTYNINGDLEDEFEKILDELTNTYKIMYKSNNIDQEDTERSVKVQVIYDSVIK